MRSILATILSLLLFLFVGCSTSRADASHEQVVREYINTLYMPATALLYQATDSVGGKEYQCVATSILKLSEGYIFLTASHCVVFSSGNLFLSTDTQNPEVYYPAKIIAYGDQNLDIDFAVLYIAAPEGAFTVMPLGHNPVQAGESLVSVSSPGGMGKLVLRGTVAAVRAPHHLAFMSGGYLIDWIGDIVFNLPGAGAGSSGSSLVCEDQMKICGVFSGHANGVNIAQPIDKFYAWWSLVQAGKINPHPPILVPKAKAPDSAKDTPKK